MPPARCRVSLSAQQPLLMPTLRSRAILAVIALSLGCHSDSTAPHQLCTGLRLLYTERTESGSTTIVAANADGSGRAVVVPSGMGATAAAWSPDGCRIAYLAGQKLYLANADGSAATPIYTAPAALDYPSWSPDGHQLLFVQDPGLGARVWRINADGSSPAALTADTLTMTSPSWSSDGTLIAFGRSMSKLQTTPFELVVTNANGTNARVIATNVGQGAAWAPGTHRLAYITASIVGGFELRTVTSDAADDRLVVAMPYSALDIAWAPAGDSLFFAAVAPTSNPPGTSWNLDVVASGGNGLHQIVAGAPFVQRPSVRR